MRPLGRTLFIVALAALLSHAAPGYGLTVSGTLSSGQWILADSPVQVTGNLTLPAGSRLVIAPGVRVEFAGAFQFIVGGVLVAEGTKDRMIVFTAANPTVDSLLWKGIRFVNGERGSNLTFVRVEYSWARGDWPDNVGGALYISGCSPTIYRSEFLHNRASADGGAIYTWFCNSSVKNSLFAFNKCAGSGAGVFLGNSNPIFTNCTVAFDTATFFGGGVFVGAQSSPKFTNCIIKSNHQYANNDRTVVVTAASFDLAQAQSADPGVFFCNLGRSMPDPYPGAGNISQNPQFVQDSINFDFHLKPTSPCIDAGDPKFVTATGPDSATVIDMGLYGGTEDAAISVPVVESPITRIEYGDLRINNTKTADFKIKNTGHQPLRISNIVFSSSAFYPDTIVREGVAMPSYLAAPIPSGDQAKYTVFFKPGSLQDYRDSLVVVCNDNVNPAPVIYLTGKGINPVARVDTTTAGIHNDTLQFGDGVIGRAVTRTVPIENIGNSDLNISYSTPNNNKQNIFFLSFPGGNRSTTVAPGSSTTLTIAFRPVRPEIFDSTVTLSSNDRNVFLNLVGRGTGPKSQLADTSKFLGYAYFRGDTVSATFRVKNVGDSRLVLTGVRSSNPGAFSVDLPAGGLAIDTSADVVIRFHPSAVTSYRERLFFTTNYPREDTLIVTGRGMPEQGRYVFGNVFGTWTWSAGSNVIVVQDSVTIPANRRLKIEPGAQIRFDPNAKFKVFGELNAIGTSTDPITFSPRNTDGADASRWNGITINGDDASRLAYCKVSGAKQGLRVTQASPRIEFCEFTNNGAAVTATPVRKGGGIRLDNSGAVISGTTISGNRANIGGGLYCVDSKPTIVNCTVRKNQAVDGAGIAFEYLCGGLLQSTLIDSNAAPDSAGGVLIADHSAPRLINNTITDNIGYGFKAITRSLPTAVNNIFWSNSPQRLYLDGGTDALVSYCDIQGGYSVDTVTNVDIDPSFETGSNPPYQLSDGSPLIDRGSANPAYRDFYFPPSKGSRRNDIGAYGGAYGGSWGIAPVKIGVYQNGAFPRWINIVLTSLDNFTAAPVCSLEIGGTMRAVALMQVDNTIYHGKAEISAEGALFLTANANVTGGVFKVSRTFDVRLINIGEGAYVDLPGLSGTLEIGSNAATGPMTIITGGSDEITKPTPGITPITDVTSISGFDLEPGASATFRVSPTQLGLQTERLAYLRLMRRELSSWIEVPATYTGGNLNAEMSGSGDYQIALADYPADVRPDLPSSPILISAYPNPFNGSVSISIRLSEAGKFVAGIYDLSGREIRTWDAATEAGSARTIVWNSDDHSGRLVASGLYFVRVTSDDNVRSTKLLLVR